MAANRDPPDGPFYEPMTVMARSSSSVIGQNSGVRDTGLHNPGGPSHRPGPYAVVPPTFLCQCSSVNPHCNGCLPQNRIPSCMVFSSSWPVHSYRTVTVSLRCSHQHTITQTQQGSSQPTSLLQAQHPSIPASQHPKSPMHCKGSCSPITPASWLLAL